MERITIGLDLAKPVLQVHTEGDSGKLMQQKRLRRGQMVAFFAALDPRWSASRPVPRRITGRKRCGRSVTRCG